MSHMGTSYDFMVSAVCTISNVFMSSCFVSVIKPDSPETGWTGFLVC